MKSLAHYGVSPKPQTRVKLSQRLPAYAKSIDEIEGFITDNGLIRSEPVPKNGRLNPSAFDGPLVPGEFVTFDVYFKVQT